MKSRVRRVAFVCVCVLILNASWCYPKVAGANELDSPGLLHLGRDAVIAVNAKETLLAAWSPDHSEEIQLCEIHTGTRRMGLSVLGDTELVHLEFMEPRGYLRGVTRNGKVLVWRGRESPEAVELEGSQPLLGHFAIDSGGAYLLHAGDSGEEGVAESVWNLASGERVLTFPGTSGLGGTFSPDGIRAVLVTPASALVGDLETKETKTVVEFTETVDLCMVSPTKRYVACQARNRVTLVDTATADVDYVDGSLGIRVYFTPSDEKLVVAHGNERRKATEIWSLEGGLRELSFERKYGQRQSAPVAVSAEGLVFHSRQKEEVLQWYAFGEGEPRLLGYHSTWLRGIVGVRDDAITLLTINRDGSRVGVGFPGRALGVWKTGAKVVGFAAARGRNPARVQETRETSRCLGILYFDDTPVEARFVGEGGSILVAFLGGESRFIVGSVRFPDQLLPTVRYRDWETYSSRQMGRVDFAPSGDRLAVALSDGVSVVEVATGKELAFFAKPSFVARFDSRGEKLFCLGRNQHGVANLRTRAYIPMNDFGRPTRPSSGCRLLTGFSVGRQVGLIDVDAGRLVNTFQGDLVQSFMQAGVSDNGQYLIMANPDRSDGRLRVNLEVFDTETGRIQNSMRTENEGLIHAHIMTDGQKAIIGSSRGAAIYDLRRRRLERVIPDEDYRDGEEAALRTRGFRGAGILRREVNTDLDSTFTLAGMGMHIKAMDINEAADRVLMAELSRVSVWELSTGNLLWMGDVDYGDVSSVAISPDGTLIAVGKDKGEVYFHRME